jgi:predicted ATPase
MNITDFKFHVIGQGHGVPVNKTGWCGYLNEDRWDDWGKFATQFYLTLVDPDGQKHQIGQVKIGEVGLKAHGGAVNLEVGHRFPRISNEFLRLHEKHFSLGQDEDYYANLTKLGDAVREQVLQALRDVAFDSDCWKFTKEEEVMGESLLRSVTKSTVEGQFRRMAHGNARLTSFSFSYTPPKRLGDGAPPYKLEFQVDPESPIPTNVHVLIGRNGVGKTRLLSLMAKTLVGPESSARQSGAFESSENKRHGSFANVVAVSFSAFDEGDLLPERTHSPDGLGYSYIGLRSPSETKDGAFKTKSPSALAKEFVSSLAECQSGSKRRRWGMVIELLQTDPVFRAAELNSMIDRNLNDSEEKAAILKTFKALSAGHKLVLLSLTRLVEKVEEKTLVLIDEPEAHLHPPLLSAMVRALSELMVNRNGVAVVATHSPVILQEVPKFCVWILNRIISASNAERPGIETFAESVGILSREVFQLELIRSGYHQILQGLRQKFLTYEAAVESLGGQLGSEGKAVLRAMFLSDEVE